MNHLQIKATLNPQKHKRRMAQASLSLRQLRGSISAAFLMHIRKGNGHQFSGRAWKVKDHLLKLNRTGDAEFRTNNTNGFTRPMNFNITQHKQIYATSFMTWNMRNCLETSGSPELN